MRKFLSTLLVLTMIMSMAAAPAFAAVRSAAVSASESEMDPTMTPGETADMAEMPSMPSMDMDMDGVMDSQDPMVMMPDGDPAMAMDMDKDGTPDMMEPMMTEMPETGMTMDMDMDMDGVMDSMDSSQTEPPMMDMDMDGTMDGMDSNVEPSPDMDMDMDGTPDMSDPMVEPMESMDMDTDMDGTPDSVDSMDMPDMDMNGTMDSMDPMMDTMEPMGPSDMADMPESEMPEMAMEPEHSTMTASASTLAPAYRVSVRISGKVTGTSGRAVSGATIEAKTAAGKVAARATTAADGTYSVSVTPWSKLTYTIYSLDSGNITGTNSEPFTIEPKVSLTRPGSPLSVYVNRTFTSIGFLKPRHTAGTYPVVIKAYRKVAGSWVLKKTFRAKASNYSTYTKYTGRVTLTARGSWKLVAFHDSAAHAATYSVARYVYVK